MTVQTATILPRLLPRIRDVVGVDIGLACVKAVRLRADRHGAIRLLAADVLPQVAVPAGTGAGRSFLPIPKPLQAWAAGVAYSFPGAVVKLLQLPADKIEQSSYTDLLGLPKSDAHRIAHLALESENRTEVPVIAVGVAAADIEWIRSLIPPGKPALGAVEVSGLAVLAAYRRVCIDETKPQCDLVIDAGERITTMAICFKGQPIVIRSFPQGAGTVAEQVMKDLGVSVDTARDILNVGSIDVRSSLHRVYDEFLRQLSIAVDFAERRSGHHIERIWLSGGLAGNQDFTRELQDQVGLASQTWDPWDRMDVQGADVSEQAKSHANGFHAATGVALGLLEGK
jgi:Tfp pilus assembly PilM family ATPase